MESIRLGNLILQPRRQLLADGQRVPLGRRGLAILSVLAEAKGDLVTKDELMATVWPNAIVEENAIQAQISALRRALGAEAERLKTIHGIGYRLDLPASVAATTGAPARPVLSIMVLPFENMSDDPDQEYFADGITEDIITDLSKVSALRVIARNSAFTLKGQRVDVRDVARRFGVSHVLEGSVRKAGGRVRITAQLIDGSDAGHVWAERYDRALQDVFALQDDVAHAIVVALKISLKPSEAEAIEDRGTDDLHAYDLFLRGRALYGQFGMESVARSVALAREAIEVDPSFIQAYRQLAASLDQFEFLMPERRQDIIEQRQWLFEQVARVAPDDPLFVMIRCRELVCRGKLLEAEALNRRVPPGTHLGTIWACPEFFGFYVGRFREMLEFERKRIEIDPLDASTSLALHDLLDINGLLDEADRENIRSRDLPADRSYFDLAYFLRGKGRASPEELARRYRSMLAGSAFVATMPLLVQLEPVLEDGAAARRYIRQAADDPANLDSLRQLWIAMLAAYFDDVALALATLRRIFVVRDHVVDLRCAMWTTVFKAVHRQPEFKQILRELGLYDYWRATGRWGDFVRPLGEDDFEVVA